MVQPILVWKPLTIADAEHLRANGNSAAATIIEVVDVPIDRAAAHATMPISALAFDPFTGRHDSAGGPTTTIDESTGLRIGIHVDNFDKLSFDQRDAGRRLVGKTR